MKIGDVARCIYTGEIVIVTSPANSAGYVDAQCNRKRLAHAQGAFGGDQ